MAYKATVPDLDFEMFIDPGRTQLAFKGPEKTHVDCISPRREVFLVSKKQSSIIIKNKPYK